MFNKNVLIKRLEEAGIKVIDGKIKKSALAKAIVIAEGSELYSYEVITHGTINYSPDSDEHANPDGELEESVLQDAIDADWGKDYLGGELGLGQYAEDLFGGGHKTYIPAPTANITHVDKFELTWDIKVDKKLTPEEEKELLSYVQGQCSDGWGEGFEQHSLDKVDCEVNCDCEKYLEECSECKGSGFVGEGEEEIECSDCDGSGKEDKCPECDGKGYRQEKCEVFASPWDRELEKQDTIKAK